MMKPSGVRGDWAAFGFRSRPLKAFRCTYVVFEIHLLMELNYIAKSPSLLSLG